MAQRDTSDTKRPWWSAITGFIKESGNVVGAVLILVGAAAGLWKILDGGDDKKSATKTPLPIVARLTGPNDMSERAFFTPRGMLVSTQYANQPGLSVVWRSADGDRRERVEVDPRSDLSTGFTLLRLAGGETGPERDFATRNGAALKPGDPVTAYLSKTAATEGTVVRLDAQGDVGGGVVENLIVVGEVAGETEGGAPLLDAEDRVRGMLFAQVEGVGDTFVIPIEDIKKKFPEAFD